LEEKNVWSVQIVDAVGAQRTVLARHTHGERWTTWSQGQTMVWNVGHELVHRQSAQSGTDAGNTLNAGLPGRISEVLVQPGALVQAGDPVLTLEAMKLYHTLSAPFTGRVAVLNVGVGDIVAQGQCLVEFEAVEAVA
jgi:acetyl/propionyl-CoA carboxylase alpha subunit